jgi:hypothetical protein
MLSNNKIAEWPGAVLGSIPTLQELHLAYNPFHKVWPAFSILFIFFLSHGHIFWASLFCVTVCIICLVFD